jgi:mxaL protein
VPIPKFDERGAQIGFYTMADVPQENRSGLPPPDAASRAGYNPRNAPFGGEAAVGVEHLTSVRETYLQTLAARTSLGYVRLDDDSKLREALNRHARPRWLDTATDLRPIPAALALLALAWFYLARRE